MGNTQSTSSNVSPLYKCLDEAMPPLADYVWDKNTWCHVESGMKGAFTDTRDREAFLSMDWFLPTSKSKTNE